MANILAVVVMLLVAALFFFLAFRASRARRAWIQWPGILLAALVGLLPLLLAIVAIKGLVELSYAPYSYAVSDVKVSASPEQLARGERLAHICSDCHSSTGGFPLDGSKDNLFAGGPPLGTVYAPNLTPGGDLKDWSDGQILRAIREGVDDTGRPMFAMTSAPFHNWSDADAQAVVAFLRAQPAVQHDTPERDLSIMTALIVGTGLVPSSAQTPITQPIQAPPAGTPEYGHYLANSVGCRDCHGADLSGGTSPIIPNGPNVTLLIRGFSEDQFVNFLKTGVDNTGRAVDTKKMPWKTYSQVFTEAEMKDLYSYLKSLPPVEKAK